MCGAENFNNERVVVRGKYRTVVNIHNPHYLRDPTGGFQAPLTFYEKAVVALPQGEDPLPHSCQQPELLPGDGALAVNCDNIQTILARSGVATPNPFEGYLVIQVPPQDIGSGQIATPELDVVAVYTARHRTGMNADVRDYDVETIDVEEVRPRMVINAPVLQECD